MMRVGFSDFLRRMSERHERLRKARIGAGYRSAAEAARALDVRGSTYAAHENGQNDFDLDVAKRYAKKFGVRWEWILDGDGGELADQEVVPFDEIGGTMRRAFVGIPDLYEDVTGALMQDGSVSYEPAVPGSAPEIDVRVGAGEGAVGRVINITEGDTYSGHLVVGEWLFPKTFLHSELKARAKGVVVLEVQGDSMRPTLEPGDRVIVDMSQNTFGPDSVLYVITVNGDEYPQVKRLERAWEEEKPMFRIISDNTASKVSLVPASRVRIIGRVVGRVSRL